MKLAIFSLALCLFILGIDAVEVLQYGSHCENTYQCNFGDRRRMYQCVDNRCICGEWYQHAIDRSGRSYCLVDPAIPPAIPVQSNANLPLASTFLLTITAYLF